VASVNGEDIMRDEFMFKVENLQNRVGPGTTATQIRNSVYTQELRRIILNSEYEALGLSVERDQMIDLLKNSFSTYPEFQNEDSIFDVNRLNAFIANLKDIQPDRAPLGTFQISYAEWTNNEQSIATNAIQQSYYNLIRSGVNATINEAEDQYIADAKTVDIKYVQIPYTSINDSLVTVTKSDIKAYMEEHKDEYTVDASREVIYVEYREDASKEDEDAIQASLMELVNDKPEFNRNTGEEENRIGLLNTEDPKGFININSDLKFEDRFLTRKDLPQTYADSLLNMAVGQVSDVYKNNGYYQISKVLETKQVPDSVKSSHIIVPYIGAFQSTPDITRTREEAESIVDSLLPLVKNNTTKFNEVADEINSDGSKGKGGEVGWTRLATFNPNAFDPDYADFIFYNDKGDVDIVETKFGFHIIRIDDAKNYEKAIKVATLAREIEASEETIDDVFNQVSKFEIALDNGEFQELAKEAGKEVKPLTFKELDENIPGLGSQRPIVRWAFENDTKVGDYQRFPVAGVGFVVAQVVKINEEGLMDVDNATTPVLAEIQKEKKAEMIRAKITGTTVDDIAKNQSQTTRTAAAVTLSNTTLSGAGVEPLVVGAAFGLSEGGTSKPIDGNRGVYVLEVTKVNDATALDNYAAILNRLSTARRNTVQSKVYSALEAAADIDDNRAKTVY
ncbi:MAG: peptidylprolyl isomerase, partial [Bacteroidota bacterium]